MGNSPSLGRKRKQKSVQSTVYIPNIATWPNLSLVVSESDVTQDWKSRIIEIRDAETGDVLNTETELEIRNKSLRNLLSRSKVRFSCPPMSEKDRSRKKKRRCLVGIDQLFYALPRLQKITDIDSVVRLCSFLEVEKEKNLKKGQALLERGLMTFDCMWGFFSVGKTVAVRLPGLNDSLIGTRITSVKYSRVEYAPFWELSGKVYKSDGKEFYEESFQFSMNYFATTRSIDDLSVQPLTSELRQHLKARGTKFRDIALSHRYMQYEGFLQKATEFGPSKLKASGRVVVDITTFNRLFPDDKTFVNPNQREISSDNNGTSTQCEYTLNTRLSDEQLLYTWPTLAGFSLQRKRWGELQVDSLTQIKFEDQAFEKLVMEPKTKDLIQAMVRSNGSGEAYFRDFISAKGGGCIFLLHGPPGTGKTLTAEAVCEYLHTPMYSVSMGELGVTPQELESNLHQILEISAIWGASILLDEADIFLEKRVGNDILRNAMVGIFLKLLEYHQGVLFLTTNRLNSFDPAFQSRISVAIKYKRLGFVSRKKIWNNFLDSVGLNLEFSEMEKLAQFKLNGRQIRNTLRLAVAVASDEGSRLQLRHIYEMLAFSERWFQDFSRRKVSCSDDMSDSDDQRNPLNQEIDDSYEK